jgi:hypothetical protein
MVKGKLETQDTMDRWGGEVWVEGLALMDRGIGEKQAKGSRHDGDHQGGEVWVESLAPMDQGNGEEEAWLRSMDLKSCVVWVIHITYEDQAKDTLIVSSGLVNMSAMFFLAGTNWEKLDKHKAKVRNIGCFILPAMRLCTEDSNGLVYDR